jgi:hypothetical protein
MWPFRKRKKKSAPRLAPTMRERRTGPAERDTLIAEYVTGPGPAHYLVTCEIREARTYAAVARVLRDWGAAPLLACVWLVETSRSALELRNAVRDALGDDDAIAVVEVQQGAWWACENAEHEGLQWLRQRVMS